MIPQLRAFPLLACLALTLLACRLAGRITGQAAMLTPTASQMPATLAVRDFPSPAALSTPTQAPASASPASVATPTSLPTAAPPAAARPKPPQSWAAEIRPTEMRTALTHLSDLIGFRVLDENGGLLGIAADYIINTCETYIIYILLAPGSDPNAEPVSRAAIPFEAVTINSGVLDAQGRAIHLHLLPGQLSGAPVLPAGAPLTPTDWEAAVREFWSGAVRISNLTTRCNATGGPVYKVAYASELLGAKLYDGRASCSERSRRPSWSRKAASSAFTSSSRPKAKGW
jgi:hypothetical protein